MALALDELRQDVRFGILRLSRSLGFAAVAVLTLALGIGATTVVFTVVDNLLFRPPPFEHIDRLMSVRDTNPEQGFTAEDNVAPWGELELEALAHRGLALTEQGEHLVSLCVAGPAHAYDAA